METKPKDNITDYLQARLETRLAIILSVIFILLYIVGAVMLGLNEARYFTYLSVGNISLFAIASVSLLRPLTKKVQLEKSHPDWKSYPSKDIPLSSKFITSNLMIYGCSSLLLVILFSQAMATKPERVRIETPPVLRTSTTESSTVPPRLAPEP